MTTILLPIEATIREAWSRVKGSKSSVIAAFGILFLVSILCGIIQAMLEANFPFLASKHVTQLSAEIIQENKLSFFFYGIFNTAISLLTFLLRIGILLIGIERAFDHPISYRLMFQALKWRTALRLIGIFLLYIILFLPAPLFVFFAAFASSLLASAFHLNLIPFLVNLIPFLVIFLWGILFVYLMVRLSLSYGFILYQQTTFWQAIKFSFTCTRYNFWRIFFLLLILGVITFLSAIPLGIGLIWTVPLAVISHGIVYRTLLGNLSQDNNSGQIVKST